MIQQMNTPYINIRVTLYSHILIVSRNDTSSLWAIIYFKVHEAPYVEWVPSLKIDRELILREVGYLIVSYMFLKEVNR